VTTLSPGFRSSQLPKFHNISQLLEEQLGEREEEGISRPPVILVMC